MILGLNAFWLNMNLNSKLNILEEQIDRAMGIDPNDVSLINLENRLHNLNLKAAKLEKSKRDVKWKVNYFRLRVCVQCPDL